MGRPRTLPGEQPRRGGRAAQQEAVEPRARVVGEEPAPVGLGRAAGVAAAPIGVDGVAEHQLHRGDPGRAPVLEARLLELRRLKARVVHARPVERLPHGGHARHDLSVRPARAAQEHARIATRVAAQVVEGHDRPYARVGRLGAGHRVGALGVARRAYAPVARHPPPRVVARAQEADAAADRVHLESEIVAARDAERHVAVAGERAGAPELPALAAAQAVHQHDRGAPPRVARAVGGPEQGRLEQPAVGLAAHLHRALDERALPGVDRNVRAGAGEAGLGLRGQGGREQHQHRSENQHRALDGGAPHGAQST